ncbi:hypothetical protein MKW92_032373 [Papaver armeniacum]|nr:hypothetical protein MKW92_032373 [Papaver armeniacum]
MDGVATKMRNPFFSGVRVYFVPNITAMSSGSNSRVFLRYVTKFTGTRVRRKYKFEYLKRPKEFLIPSNW